jgi:hypothetical protein
MQSVLIFIIIRNTDEAKIVIFNLENSPMKLLALKKMELGLVEKVTLLINFMTKPAKVDLIEH